MSDFRNRLRGGENKVDYLLLKEALRTRIGAMEIMLPSGEPGEFMELVSGNAGSQLYKAAEDYAFGAVPRHGDVDMSGELGRLREVVVGRLRESGLSKAMTDATVGKLEGIINQTLTEVGLPATIGQGRAAGA